MNSSDIIVAFLNAMAASGIEPAEPIGNRLLSGELIRFPTKDKPRHRNGWAVLHLDGKPAGSFGAYHLGVSEKWRLDDGRKLTAEERVEAQRQWRAAAERRAKEKFRRQEAAAGEAERLWNASGPLSPEHLYLVRKSMPGEGLRQYGNVLLVPMRDIDGKLWNLQRIAPDGSKRFLFGGRTEGLFFSVGSGGPTLCIGEGIATMAAVRAATGYATTAAFSAENLEPVARLIRKRWPNLDLVICADNDAHLVNHPRIRRNLGVEYATAAAKAVGGRLAIPGRAT